MKSLKFKELPKLEDLAGIEIEGARFELSGDTFSMFEEQAIYIMQVPGAFRFTTNLEIITFEGAFYLLTTQSLTRCWDYWEMSKAVDRLNHNDENKTGDKVQKIIDELLRRDLVEWVEE